MLNIFSNAYLPSIYLLQYNILVPTFLFGFCFFTLSFWDVLTYSRCESFVLYVVCKYYLSVLGLFVFFSIQFTKSLLQSIFAFSLNFDFIISWFCFLFILSVLSFSVFLFLPAFGFLEHIFRFPFSFVYKVFEFMSLYTFSVVALSVTLYT